jgi:hypothetical protein
MNRVWTYISSRQLSPAEQQSLLSAGKAFVTQWTAHEQQLHGDFTLEKGRILVVRVNETVTAASGCSIDKLTRFIRGLEKDFNTELLNRLLVAYEDNNGELQVTHASKIKGLIENGSVTEQTIVLNTAVASENELSNWRQPLKDTWLRKYLVSA